VSREAAAREAASRLTFHRQTETSNSRRWLWLLGGLLAAAALGGGSGYLYFVQARLRVPPPPPTKSAEEVAALSRVRELEERIATLEREKAEAEARAAEDARRKLESQAAARGQAVDPAAVERVQEEARRRARAEEEQRQQEERRRLAEQKKAEERIATAPRAAETTPAPTPEPTPTPTSTPTPPPTPMPTPEPEPPSTPPPVRPGTLVTSEEPGVAPPTLLRDGPVGYPDRARELRAQATVVVRALVDEKGNVAEVTVVQRSGTPLGFDEAAVRRVKGRLYRPATKDGVPVRMWVSVRVEFRL
jgi:TonB family protein